MYIHFLHICVYVSLYLCLSLSLCVFISLSLFVLPISLFVFISICVYLSLFICVYLVSLFVYIYLYLCHRNKFTWKNSHISQSSLSVKFTLMRRLLAEMHRKSCRSLRQSLMKCIKKQKQKTKLNSHYWKCNFKTFSITKSSLNECIMNF